MNTSKQNRIVVVSFFLALVILTVSNLMSFRSSSAASDTNHRIKDTYDLLIIMRSTLSTLQDAETGVRGYVITGEEHYLEPYHRALSVIDEKLGAISQLSHHATFDIRSLDTLQILASLKLAYLEKKIEVRRSQGFEEARLMTLTDEGKHEMDQIRALLTRIQNKEEATLAENLALGLKYTRRENFLKSAATFFSFILLLLAFSLLAIQLRQQRNTERILRSVNERFSLLVNGVKEYALCLLDPEGRVVGWNKGAERLMGYKEENILNSHNSCFYPEEEIRDGRPDLLLKVAAETGRHEEEGWRLRKDGSRFWASELVTALRDPQGALEGYAKLTRDLTLQKEMEGTVQIRAEQQAAIAELGQKALEGTDLNLLMEETVYVVAEILDVDYCKILELLPPGKKLLLKAGVGWKEGYVGKAHVEAEINSQAAFTLKTNLPVIVENLNSETRFSAPALLLEHRVVSGVSVIIPGEKQPYGVLGIHTRTHRKFSEDDIYFLLAVANILSTAIGRKNAEENLRIKDSAIESSLNAIALGDLNGRISYANPSFQKMWGYDSFDEIIGKNILEFWQEKEAAQNVMNVVLSRGSWSGELKGKRKNGSVFDTQLSSTVVRDKNGQPLCAMASIMDITPSKKMESALRESEFSYRTLAENLPGIVYRVYLREKHRMQFFNRAASQITGYTEEELKSGEVCSLDPLILPEDRSGVVAEVRNAVREKRPFKVEYRLRHKDGSIRYLLEQGIPVANGDGKVWCIDGIVNDITERREAEKKQREQAEMLSTIIKNIPVMITRYDAAGNIHLLNNEFERLTGYTTDELPGVNLLELCYPDPDYRQEVWNYMASAQPGWRDFTITTRYGNKLKSVWANVRLSDGSQIGIGIDVGEQRKAEAMLREQAQVIDQIHDGVVSTDLDGIVTSWNKGAERIFGYSAREMIGKHISYVYSKDQQEFLEAGIIAPLKEKGNHDVVVRMLRKSGEPFYAHLVLSLLRDEEGKLKGMIGYTQDVTEREEFQQKLQEQNRRVTTILESISDAFFSLDRDGCFTYVNSRAEQLLKKSAEDLLSRNVWELFPEAVNSPFAELSQDAVGERVPVTFVEYYDPLDSWFEVHVYPSGEGISVYFQDVSVQKRAEIELRAANRALRTRSELSQAIVRISTEQELLNQACSIIVESGGYRLAWVGYAVYDKTKSIRPVAQKGYEYGYLQTVKLTWADRERGRGPAGTAVRSGKAAIAQHIQSDPDYAPWRKEAVSRGYASSIALPLKSENQVFGCLNMYAAEPDAFDAEEVRLLVDLANDLAFGIIALRNREERVRVEKALRESEERYHTLFEESPVPLWEEDFSELKKQIDKLKKRGVRHFRRYIDARPGLVQELLGKVKIMDINRAVLKLHEAGDRGQLLSALSRYFTDESLDTFKEELLAVAEGRNFLERETTIKTLNRQEANVIFRWIVVPGYEEEFSKILVSVIDITARKKAEQALRLSEARYRGLLETAPDGIITLDSSGKIVLVNRQGEKMFGYSQKELIGKPVDVLLPRRLRKKHKNHRQIYVMNPETRPMGSGLELLSRNKNGHLFPVEVSLSPLVSEKEMLVTAVVRDISERKKAEEKLRKNQEQLRMLSSNLLTIREEEREHIAREIHDELGQQLTGLKMDLYWIKNRLEKREYLDNIPNLKNKMMFMSGMIDKSIKSVRRIATELRPGILDDVGLPAAIEWQGREFEQRTGITCRIKNPVQDLRLDRKQSIAVFRIFQESLTNVARHAKATEVSVEVKKYRKILILQVKDNGRGIKESEMAKFDSLGILGIRERALSLGGQIEIKGEPNSGTTVTLKIPLQGAKN